MNNVFEPASASKTYRDATITAEGAAVHRGTRASDAAPREVLRERKPINQLDYQHLSAGRFENLKRIGTSAGSLD